ncbi:MAG: hypothetical protein WA419_10665 [Silvibacterium sp.]
MLAGSLSQEIEAEQQFRTRTPENVDPRMLMKRNAIAIQPSGAALASMYRR